MKKAAAPEKGSRTVHIEVNAILVQTLRFRQLQIAKLERRLERLERTLASFKLVHVTDNAASERQEEFSRSVLELLHTQAGRCCAPGRVTFGGDREKCAACVRDLEALQELFEKYGARIVNKPEEPE